MDLICLLAVEPVQNGERRVTVQRPAELPIVYVGYPVPNQTSADAPARRTPRP